MPMTCHIDMPGGVAGDMLLAALLAAGGDRDRLLADLAGLGLGPVGITVSTVKRRGIACLRAEVEAPQEATWDPSHSHGHHHHGHHHHRPWSVIRDLLARADLPERVRERSQRAFRLLAEAEAAVHGVDPEGVHFHEVGSLDAIVDVVGIALLLEQLGVDRITAEPPLLGNGHVDCAHGRMPVPVPAVVELLARRGAPSRRARGETGEMTTPTGCALLCALVDAWQPPAGRLRSVGYGAGGREVAGLLGAVRVSLVEVEASPSADDRVVELRTVLDDASGEDCGDLLERLLAAGARDAWLAPVTMKKSRPGWELVVLAAPDDGQRLAALVLDHSPALGLRRQELHRTVLPRHEVSVTVDGHAVRLKVATRPDGRETAKPEADDVAAVARATGRGRRAIADEALARWTQARLS